MRRFWKLAMLVTVGVLPVSYMGCFDLYGEKVGFLNMSMADPWYAAANSPNAPTGIFAAFFNSFLNTGPNEQRLVNTMWNSLYTLIKSNIAVYTPQGWVDVGRPR